ncbi:MAG TPA: large conductance mechanosensitive channel protein MscL [Rhizomicrobium sp.]|jgi:large conductance mechanosensitive channel|nr:large conductance mechanosensitive channel protein MscL [Rhizomicrobium sp.]
MFQEFRTFVMRGNVIDLAVGVIIGAAFTGIVTSLVKDVLTPPIGLLLGGIDFANLFITLKGGHGFPTLKAATEAGAVTLNYGLFINAVLSFLIVAFVLFLLLHQINKLKTPAKDSPPAQTPEDIQLLREIRDALKARP